MSKRVPKTSSKLPSSVHPFHTGFLSASDTSPGVMAVRKQMCPSHEYDKDVTDPQWIPVWEPLVISFIQCLASTFCMLGTGLGARTSSERDSSPSAEQTRQAAKNEARYCEFRIIATNPD